MKALSQTALARINRIARRYPVKQLSLFGSRARGTARPDSDFDFLVRLDYASKPGLLELGGLQHELSEALNSAVDVVVYDERLPERILRDATSIFERD